MQHGVNGMLADPGRPEALLDAVRRVLADRARFSQQALACARQELSLDRMVEGLTEALTFAAAGGG